MKMKFNATSVKTLWKLSGTKEMPETVCYSTYQPFLKFKEAKRMGSLSVKQSMHQLLPRITVETLPGSLTRQPSCGLGRRTVWDGVE